MKSELKKPPTERELIDAQTRILRPHTGLDAFRDAARALVSRFRQARELAWRFFIRDTKADHRQSVLGYLWLVFPALANTVTWVFLNNQKIVHIDSGNVPYPLFVLSGTILWTAFNGSLMGMLGVVGAARGFLAKVNFPHEALVYSAALKSSLDAILAALILIPAVILFGNGVFGSMALFPLALAGSLILGWSLGLLMVPLAALYSDVSRALQIILRFGFFLTPVIFPLPSSGIARKVMLLNPATPILVTGRDWLTHSGEAMTSSFLIVLLGCLLVIPVATLFYKVALPHLIERLSP
jgi:lipopolysaccharide transport system permease protein